MADPLLTPRTPALVDLTGVRLRGAAASALRTRQDPARGKPPGPLLLGVPWDPGLPGHATRAAEPRGRGRAQKAPSHRSSHSPARRPRVLTGARAELTGSAPPGLPAGDPLPQPLYRSGKALVIRAGTDLGLSQG